MTVLSRIKMAGKDSLGESIIDSIERSEWGPERLFLTKPNHDLRTLEQHLAEMPGITEDEKRYIAVQHRIGDEIMRSRMPPAGALHLSKHLDQRRLDYFIPYTAFRTECVFDRIYVYQISAKKQKDKFIDDGLIYIPPSDQKGREQEASRGIIVSAGLGALDRLASHGMEVGDIIQFTRLSPFRQWFDKIEGIDQYLLALHGGDPISCEDLRRKLWDGTLKIAQVDDGNGGKTHVYQDQAGNYVRPLPAFDTSGDF
jgi:hypothetical protein